MQSTSKLCISFCYTCQMLRAKIDVFTWSTYFLIFLVTSCGTPEEKQAHLHQRDSKSITVEYAQRFKIVKKADRTYVYVNADSTQPAYTYLLAPKNSGIKAYSGEVLINTPVDKLVVTSTSHIAFLDIINGLNQVSASQILPTFHLTVQSPE